MQLRTIPLLATALVVLAACGPTPDGADRAPRPMPGEAPPPTQLEMEDAAQDFGEIRSGYLEWYFEAHPVKATELGVHDFDGRMPAVDRVGIQRRIDDLLGWLGEMEQVRFDLMRDDDRYDYAVLEYGIREELLELEEARGWANDPGFYTDLIARGLSSVAERKFAPLRDRAESLQSRMAAATEVLDAARDNLSDPPQVWTELAVANARGLLEYLERDLPALLAAQDGDAVPQGLEAARTRLVDALRSHIRWLSTDLLPRSNGSYRLGRYLLERRLLYGDHISLGLDELERLNLNAINEYRKRLADVAAAIDSTRTPREIIDSIGRIGPATGELLDRAREDVIRARDWLEESGVVPVPRDRPPTVRETPPFARLAFSSLDAPGPFDPDSLEAFYNLTDADTAWDDTVEAQHMAFFSDAGLMLNALHETFPGHYIERQYARDRTDLRKVLVARAFTDGWAHYATEMALDQGFSDDPGLRVEQLRRALQRQARWWAVIRIHAEGDSLEQVVAGYMEIAYFDREPARLEVLRATRDPGLMADALGRMQIMELRKDYRAAREEADEEFSLSEFHTRLLRLGLPFPLAREIMIPAEDRRRRPR